MSTERYNPKKIQVKWQKKWSSDRIFQANIQKSAKPFLDQRSQDFADKPKFYNLMMFPYPSGEGLHVGHVYAFGGADTFGHFKKMQGFDVFEPMGFDSFGIHSENYALKIKKHPQQLIDETTKYFREEQLQKLGALFDWDHEVITSDIHYYKWTQWLFVQLFKVGLAVRKKATVDWCPSCKTVLADEQVIAGKCERCNTEVIQKELEQWFFKITDYAQKLLDNLDHLPDRQAGIDWSETTKTMQRNWIGRSEGTEIEFEIAGPVPTLPPASAHELRAASSRPSSRATRTIKIYTTRPDTIFGATFMVVAPEHPQIDQLITKDNKSKASDYINQARNKSEVERAGEKSGVFTGSYAINPLTKKEIPIWVAEYVLLGYGTGAIMAVPSHDQRDFEFAKKYDLPVIQVVAKNSAPIRSYLMGGEKISDEDLKSLGVKILATTKEGYRKIEIPEAKLKEYEELITEKMTPGFWNEYVAKEIVFIFKFKDGSIKRLVLDVNNEEEVDKLGEEFNGRVWEKKGSVWKWLAANDTYTDLIIHDQDGTLVNSGEFNGLTTKDAGEKLSEYIENRHIGSRKVNFHLRDWLISRQRYWGPPIPMVYCDNCAKKGKSWFSTEEAAKRVRSLEFGVRNDEEKTHNSKLTTLNSEMTGWYPVPEEDLPVELPYVENYQPKGSGVSPLAAESSFVEVACPECGKTARRETDVSDTFLDSSWYFLRYPSVGEESSKVTIAGKEIELPWNQEITKKWLPIDMYIGGNEHAVLHLLYSRFVTMALHDMGLIDFAEPYKKFRAHALIIYKGAKMSKSRGNVVNPNEYIDAYGSDALKMYLLFIGPYELGGEFNDRAIVGVYRFLSRVWTLVQENKFVEKTDSVLANDFNKLNAKVASDLENLKFNTAIAALMEFLNELYKNRGSASREIVLSYLLILAPFAPFTTEELWEFLGETSSIHLQKWPEQLATQVKEEKDLIVIQVNGRFRDKIEVEKNAPKEEVSRLALDQAKVKIYTQDKLPKNIIYVVGKLLNIVI